MPVFTIEGIRYTADRYIDAANLHRAQKAELLTAQIKSVTAPKVVTPVRSQVVQGSSSSLVRSGSSSSLVQSGGSSQVSSSGSATVVQPSQSSQVQQIVPSDLSCYRGEKSEWWPPPEIRLMFGMTIREPWAYSSMTELFGKLQAEIRQSSRGKVADFAQFLRAEGKPWALATARTGVGSYTSDYNYALKIKNARTFYWIDGGISRAPTIGAPANFHAPEQVDADYIVLNADTIQDSTVLGFGHKTATFEVTFFHDVPLDLVDTVNGAATSSVTLTKWSELTFDQKIKFSKLKRNG